MSDASSNGNIFADVTSIRELLGQLTGAASMCWENVAKAGVFDSTRATALVDDALARIAELSQRYET